MALGLGTAAPASADQVILDDLIVDGSGCFGLDCINGEVFGFDTLRLKENNLRIRFFDTSNSASFPTNDWQITANDSSNGGGNYLAFDDIDGGRQPFRVDAGARSNALRVASSGRVGIGTGTPVADLHVKNGNTPTLRLEQDGSNGFSAQTWDVASNEANFFVRDASNGSTLPFRIFPGAPTNALTVAGSGNVGVGTNVPSHPFHLKETNGSARALIEDTGNSPTLLDLSNNGPATARLLNTSTGSTWNLSASSLPGEDFMINTDGANPKRFLLDQNGNLTVSGIVSGLSDRRAKQGIKRVKPRTVLARVLDLEISEWQFRDENDPARHIGPMAQDFHKAFGLGKQRRALAPSDVGGVALASIQALARKNAKLLARVKRLEKRVNESR